MLLIATVAGTAWCAWAETQPVPKRKPKAQTPTQPTPVEVVWDDTVDSVEDKRAMLDRVFAQGSINDDDVDPPTVVAGRR